jgi:predicted pyridoxine 5'-phosphate oxidase superfamily flavin-nucleotide-binding protein
MSRRYRQIAITQDVLALQALNGTWHHGSPVARADSAPADRLGPSELAFLADRHGFYVASAGATGWPDAQHRGESPGFLRVLDTLGWPDFAGNEQYVTTGNIAGDDWVALIVMDYAGQRRLKAGGARVQPARDVPNFIAALAKDADPAAVERVVTVAVAACD